MLPDPNADYTGALRPRVPDLRLINPQVSLVSRDGRFLRHPMGLFETVAHAVDALRAAADAEGVTPSFEGVFTYADPVRNLHTVDFLYRLPGEVGPAFREPDEGERWVLRQSASGGTPGVLHEHPDLGARLYPRPFYHYLRPFIGTDWILGIGASTLVMDDDGMILLQKRRDNGLWAHPGGCLEPGERVGDTAVREAEEETGYRVGGAVLSSVATWPECVITYPNGDRLRYLDFVFQARVTGGSARPESEETLDVGWFDPRALPPQTMEITRTHIRRLLGAAGRFLLD